MTFKYERAVLFGGGAPPSAPLQDSRGKKTRSATATLAQASSLL
jgi:hypothetical protein